MMARPHQLRANVPTSFGAVPLQLSMWLNDTDGDCVTAEEAFAKAAWFAYIGGPELFVPDSEVQAWASAGGFLNGAVLSDVLEAMAKSGFTVSGTNYTDGPAESVDYTNWATLTSAISAGPVKIGVDADDIEPAVNTTNGASGWFGTGWTDSNNQDHCVSLCGYGTVAECYGFLNIPVPSSAQGNASDEAVLLYTWKSIGVVLFPSMVAVTSEAWLRTPTTPQQVGPGPAPTPGPTPGPTPNPTIPATAGWFDPVAKQIHAPAGWTSQPNNFDRAIVANPTFRTVSVPAGWTEV
jgi:hypothetical protein